MKVAFLDRDGTIIKDYPDKEWAQVKEPEFFSNSIAALKEIRNLGYEIIIITNQYIINEGIISLQDYYSFHDQFLKALNSEGIEILDTFFCPHTDAEECDCKKPKIGMIQNAIKKYPSINLNDSFIAGDSLCDAYLALNLNMKCFIIDKKDIVDVNITYVNSLYDILQKI